MALPRRWSLAGHMPETSFEEMYARFHLKGRVGCEGIYDDVMRPEV
jgi:hypothetical protein